MKTNIFKSSFLAFAMMASFSACTQNEEIGTLLPTDNDVLNVVAYSNSFVDTEENSRVADEGSMTKFENDDAIGVFVVRDGKALVRNMKMTFNGTAWSGNNNAPLYYYSGADYIAYYPYTENLSVTSEQEIVEYFKANIGENGQTSLADYRNADLMTAEVKAANVVRGQNITFSFAHKMAMIEIKAPVRSYTTEDGSFTYKAPLGLKVKNGGQTLSLCNVGTDATAGKDIFRCILVPSDTQMTIQGQFQDGIVEVYFPSTNSSNSPVTFTPTAGKYKSINILYDYNSYTSTRNLQPGDYFYSDGSIYPGDLEGAPIDGCVGIIFSTSVTEPALKDTYTHGYVVALKNTSGVVGSTGYGYWGDGALSDNSLASSGDWSGIDNGYAASISTELSNLDAVKAAKEYNVALPDNTSGWYLPSVKQIVDILNNLATVSDGWTFSTSNAYNDNTDATKKKEMLEQIQPKFDAVGGIMLKDDGTNYTDRWWTTTEVNSANEAWCLEMNINNGRMKLLNRTKSGNSSHRASVRPVFAF